MADYVVIEGQKVPRVSVERAWKCGICDSPIITRTITNHGVELRTVCSKDEDHPADAFIPKSIGKDKQKTYQYWYDKTKEERMSFVKDRHTEDGKLMASPRVRRAGRISLGEKTDRGGARSLPYFTFKSYDEGDVADVVLEQVYAAIDHYAKGQEDPAHPTVLPVYLPADLELIGKSAYKLAGKEGRPRCVGDGEYIQFKLGPHNLLEVSDGQVRATNFSIDGQKFEQGDLVFCPGKSNVGRWGHCDQCRLVLEIDLHIAGLPYIWGLSTGDKSFYDQFFTVLEVCNGYIEQGIVRFLPEIPLLLRREEGMRARPTEKEGDVYLTWQEMNTLSIEVHPVWKSWADAKKLELLSGEPPKSLSMPRREALPEPTPWHERVKEEMPKRPWTPEQVLEFVTKGMNAYRQEDESADDGASESTVKVAYSQPYRVYEKQGMSEKEAGQATDLAFWCLFGGKLTTNAQCAAVWRWAKDEVVSDGKQGSVPNPNFEQEALDLLSWASQNAGKDDYDEEDAPPPEDE